DHPFAEALAGKLIKPFNGSEILRKRRLLELGAGGGQIVTLEFGVGSHATGQEPAAERAITEGRDLVLAAIGQDLGLDFALEEAVWRLQYMQWRDAAEPLHLQDGKIAHPDGADLALLEKHAHCFGGFFDRNQRIRPMDL